MSNHRAFGNIKMRGKKVVKNPCPCCDPIENSRQILVEEIDRLENLEAVSAGMIAYPKRIASLKKRLEELDD